MVNVKVRNCLVVSRTHESTVKTKHS